MSLTLSTTSSPPPPSRLHCVSPSDHILPTHPMLTFPPSIWCLLSSNQRRWLEQRIYCQPNHLLETHSEEGEHSQLANNAYVSALFNACAVESCVAAAYPYALSAVPLTWVKCVVSCSTVVARSCAWHDAVMAGSAE